MKRKNIVLLIAVACLGLACVCVPAELIPIIEYNIEYYLTEQPATGGPAPLAPPADLPQVQADDDVYHGDIPACISNLEDVLYEAENTYRPGEELASEYTLVTYEVDGNRLSDPHYASVPAQVAEYQEEDDARYREIWAVVTDILPADQRTLISHFVVYTDGVGGSLGAVEQTDNLHDWMLELDSVDSAYFPELSTTLIHELTHLLTLNDTQLTTDPSVYNHPDDAYVYENAVSSCATYFIFEGCSNEDSYLTAFYNRFWPEIYDQWVDITYEEDETVYEDRLDAFYQNYADQFVSSYAATSPEEDIAESFLYFIFSTPDGYGLAGEKIGFFYNYPELVELRTSLLANLCTYVE